MNGGVKVGENGDMAWKFHEAVSRCRHRFLRSFATNARQSLSYMAYDYSHRRLGGLSRIAVSDA
jgi:hypothetical protein